MYLSIEDVAKIGQLILQKGRWLIAGKHEQIVAEDWMKQMTSIQAKTGLQEDYGYQIWVDQKERYVVMTGLFGQLVYIDAEQQLVVAITAGNTNILNAKAVIKYILDNFRAPLARLTEQEIATVTQEILTDYLQACTYNQHELLAPQVIQPQKITTKVKHFLLKALGKTVQQNLQYPLPASIQPYLEQTYIFDENKASIIPLVMQMMSGNYSQGVQHVKLFSANEQLVMTWQEVDNIISLPIGLYQDAYSQLTYNNETFAIATYGKIAYDEEGRMVLFVTICYLEMSSVRKIKIFFDDEHHKIIVDFDESPSLTSIMSTAMKQMDLSLIPNFLQKDTGYLNFIMMRLCTP